MEIVHLGQDIRETSGQGGGEWSTYKDALADWCYILLFLFDVRYLMWYYKLMFGW